MRIRAYYWAVPLAGLLAACSVTAPITRHGANASLKHTTKKQREQVVKNTGTQYIKTTRLDGTEAFLVQGIRDKESGEEMMSLRVDEVVVVAKSRTRPERCGRVDLDFVIDIPKSLQGACRSIALTPVLHKADTNECLKPIIIRGSLFDKVQSRDYWQYDKYSRLNSYDSVRLRRAFWRFVRYPYPEDVRLDSVAERPDRMTFFYTQSVPTAGVDKRLTITMQGDVTGLDGSRAELPGGDTLEYNISSMLTFLDTTVRYKTRIIEKYAQVRDKNFLTFRVNDTRIIDSLGENRAELEKIEALMHSLFDQHEYYVDSIVLTAASSPEGTYARNGILARQRAYVLRDYLTTRFEDCGLDTMIRIRSIPEDWAELYRLIEAKDALPEREAALRLCQKIKDPDRREKTLREKFPDCYRLIRRQLYPRLRSVSFKYDLRRVGMIKDTIHTTEPDTLYAHGVHLLEKRQYAKALYILSDYKDQNTAIALLSLGYDQAAREILEKLPPKGMVHYLTAIACARLGDRPGAASAFEKACAAEERFRYRASLDPELSELVKNL